MRMIFFIGLLSSLILLQNCGNETAKDNEYKINNSDTVLTDWKVDSLGCKGLRSADKARLLFKRYDLKSKMPGELIEVLGKPNKATDNGVQSSLTYFFDTKCSDGKVIDSIEYCSASFFYIDKKKKDCSLSTSCQ